MRQTTLSNRISVKIKLLRLGGGGERGVLDLDINNAKERITKNSTLLAKSHC